MNPWLNLSPSEFEEFCYLLLEANGFKSLEWYGVGGGDKGRDIICTKAERILDGVEVTRKWVVQCRHYRKAKITKGSLNDWIAACREHKPDSVLLITSGTLSANLKDWLHALRSEYSFDILTWQEIDLRRQYVRHGGKIRAHFPQLGKVGKRVEFSEGDMSQRYFWCDEFDEAAFLILNDYGPKRNAEYLQEFVAFIKANDIHFSTKPCR